MPLVTATLQTELVNVFSSNLDSVNTAATKWASAFTTYVTPIFPASTTITAAKTTLENGLKSVFKAVDSENNPTYTSISEFVDAITPVFEDWATEIGDGMTATHTSIVAPTATALKAPLKAAFDANFALTGEDSTVSATRNTVATNISAVFTPWFATGSAVLSVSPFTPTVWL